MNRDTTGKFRKFIIRVFILLIAISVIAGLVHLYITTHPVIRTVTNTVTIDYSKEMFASKIESLEKSLVEQIRKCESAGHKESDGLIVFDSNHVASIGTLQFQVKTVIYYYRTLYQRSITGKEAIVIALDDNLSGSLAKDILFSSPNLANDWANCANKLSINDQIIAIKKIK